MNNQIVFMSNNRFKDYNLPAIIFSHKYSNINFIFTVNFRLMAKFSKKIVSKSLYVLILKQSTPHLLNM